MDATHPVLAVTDQAVRARTEARLHASTRSVDGGDPQDDRFHAGPRRGSDLRRRLEAEDRLKRVGRLAPPRKPRESDAKVIMQGRLGRRSAHGLPEDALRPHVVAALVCLGARLVEIGARLVEIGAGSTGRQREDELARLSSFFAARIEEEDERSRRRGPNGDESEMEGGDATSLKLEWERRAAEVRHRWALRTEVRMWGLEEWAWPVADLEQERRAGAGRVKLTSGVDVARGRPALAAWPGRQASAEMLVRARGGVACVRCAP